MIFFCLQKLKMEIHKDESYIKIFTDIFDNIQQNQQFFDVTLKVGTKEYPCHRIILAASSNYFTKMFFSNFKEANSPVVELFGISHEAFDELYKYIYTGEICLSKNIVFQLYDISDMYMYDSIKKQCLNYIHNNINISNCVDCWCFGFQRNLTDLTKKCISMISNNFTKTSLANNFLVSFPYETFLELLNGEIDVEYESYLLDIVCNWMKYHPEISSTQKELLLDKIRWGLLHIEDFQRFFAQSEKFNEFSFWYSIVHEHKKTNLIGKIKIEKKYPKQFQPRGLLNEVIVGGLRKSLDKIRTSNKTVIKLPRPIQDTAAVRIGNHIFVIGGRDGHAEFFPSGRNECAECFCYEYDMKSKIWQSLQHMNTPRYRHVAVANEDGKILVAGGQDKNGTYLKSVEMYDIEENTWTYITPLKTGVSFLKGCCHNNEIYVLGGGRFYGCWDRRGSSCRKNKDILKYSNGEWICVSKLPLENDRYFTVSGVCSVNDKIYMSGFKLPDYLILDTVQNILTKEKNGGEIPVLERNTVLIPVIE